MFTALIKALLINAAYEGAAAVCGPLVHGTDGKEIALDPLIQDSNLRSKGLLVYEEAKCQYAVLVQAFQDKTGIWPDPQTPDLTTLLGSLSGANLTQLVPLITQLTGLIKNPTATPAPATTVPPVPPLGSATSVTK
jgi:hypothetical protein